MKQIYLFSALIFSAIFLHAQQWEQLNLPEGCAILTMAGSNDTLYAGTKRGVFKSVNNGASWSNVSNGIPTNKDVSSIIINNNKLYTVVSGSIYVSYDYATSWNKITFDYSPSFKGSPTTIMGKNNEDSTIYFNSYTGGLYVLKNEKTTFDTLINSDKQISSLVENNGYLFAMTDSNGVYRSSDKGLNWSAVNSGISSVGFGGYLAAIGNDIYASIEDPLTTGKPDYIYHSSDNGSNWQKVNSLTASSNNIFGLYASDGKLFASHYKSLSPEGGIYVSSDKGQTWSLFYNTWRFYRIYANNSRYFLMNNGGSQYSGGGIIYKDKSGSEFMASVSGLAKQARVSCMHHHNNTIYCGTYENGIYSSSDNGVSWVAFNSGLPLLAEIRSIVNSGSLLLALVSKEDGVDMIYLYQNNQWSPITDSNQDPYKVLAGNDKIYFSTFNSGAYQSSDLGQTWTDVIGVEFIYAIHNDSILYGINSSKDLYKSTNYGNSWTKNGDEDYDFSYNSFVNLYVSGSNLLGYGQNDPLFISKNDGDSWDEAILNINYAQGVLLQQDKVFAGVTEPGFKYSFHESQDNGNAWLKTDTLPKGGNLRVIDNLGYLYASNSSYIYRKNVGSPTGISSISNSEELSIYPNPSTGIIYISNSSNKNRTIVIVNELGMEVHRATLLNNNIQLDVSALSSGLYFYSVFENNEISSTGKLLKL